MPETARHEENLDDLFVAGHEDEVESSEDLNRTDYATRLEEILGRDDEEEEGEEGFLYQGEDSQEVSGTYNEQLQDFLRGLDDDVVDTDLEEERQVEEHLEDNDAYTYEEASTSDHKTSSLPSSPVALHIAPESSPNPRSEVIATTVYDSPAKGYMTKPFLHPNISRLRSFLPPQQSRVISLSSVPNASPSPSHFSAMSRTSSTSHLQNAPGTNRELHEEEREAFRWAVLRDISERLYLRTTSSILGSSHGSPTVLAANGLICIGTDRGRVLVFDFKQHLRCVCGTGDPSESAGPVSALSLSHDHTYIAVGHAHGHINLYDLSRPQVPARSVPPTTLPTVLSGRREGHIQGTQILGLGFVGARHTAIVSADENGLAFYHSLGKVLFIEASDTLRILGKYRESPNDSILLKKGTKDTESLLPHVNGSGATPPNPARSRPWKPRKSSTILAMASLPLGTATHPTEAYSLIALLTPAKLVVVGLAPSPRTWFRCHRDTGISSAASKWRGCLVWFPSVNPVVGSYETIPTDHHVNGKHTQMPKSLATRPVLAYTWDRSLYILRVSETKVKQTVRSTKNPGKTTTVEVGKIEMEEVARWSSGSDYLAIQWLNVHQLLALTARHLEVWDVRTSQRVEFSPFNAKSLLSNTDPGIPEDERIAHSIRVCQGKIFLLGRQELRVGTLLSWADRILALVGDGDFLSAIETARSYYLGTAAGNRIGLPEDPSALRNLVGKRMRDLMTASLRYAFAEERMTDSTHVTPDGRGVDRTSLFEGLVTVCAKACIALNDFEFLFEDLFEEYDNACIAPIFLQQLEQIVLDGTLRTIPPRITQRLISLHEDRGDLGNAERLIWHIDPDCLDINQAITICRTNRLYDAVIYVYTRSLHDYVAPVVELLDLVRQIQQHRRALHLKALGESSILSETSLQLTESLVSDAYKIYTYLADILSGLTYPSQIPMSWDEALRAKKDIYHFLFKGLSCAYVGVDGRLFLTSDEEGGVELTYPYVRLLLRFDAEAFLHTMDIAFEDSYFNEDQPDIDRLVITRILLEILSTTGISCSDATMLNIFIARNVPKYPQSIDLAPSTLLNILVGLAQDPDQDTWEDRQLAAEYLLSVYTPQDSERMIRLFDNAKFFRILRSWYRQEHKWGLLVSTYLRDSTVDTAETFHNIDNILIIASHPGKGSLSGEISTIIMDAIPRLLDSSITETAILIDKHAPNLHAQVLETIGNDASYKQFAYLRCLLEPSALLEERHWTDPMLLQLSPSRNLDRSSQELYLNLLCKFDSPGVINCLETLEDGYFDWDMVVSVCEKNGVHQAVFWSLNKRGDVKDAFQTLENVDTHLASQLCDLFVSESNDSGGGYDIQRLSDELTALGKIALRICQDHSMTGRNIGGLTIEDMWFRLLSSQIDTVQKLSGICSIDVGDGPLKTVQVHQTLESLRSLVQTTFTSLVAQGSSPVLSFPRLFRRLVDSTSRSRSSSRSSYSEFRIILTGMLDSYRSEEDLLLIINRLIGRDLFSTVTEFIKCSARGSRARGTMCTICNGPLQQDLSSSKVKVDLSHVIKVEDWLVQRLTGRPYHRRCLPLTIDPSP